MQHGNHSLQNNVIWKSFAHSKMLNSINFPAVSLHNAQGNHSTVGWVRVTEDFFSLTEFCIEPLVPNNFRSPIQKEYCISKNQQNSKF